MSVPLDIWQERMESHFFGLKARRERSRLPIFALEHGLPDESIAEIAAQLRQRLIRGEKLGSHWLLWTIYAAERGYTYEGDEYWQSFTEATPGWESGDRYRVSNWFEKFQSSYDGVVPSGQWAGHFSIIAWPITHAVLPRFLQRQFARMLYELRYRLARIDDIDPATIGRLVASDASFASTRLEQFLQQEELVGRLVLALLHQDQVEGEEPLLPATLERIVGDLEQVRGARAWIKEASRVVSDRFKGLGRGTSSRQFTPGGQSTERYSLEARPEIRPDLRLHYTGQGSWDLHIDIPSFKDVGALNAEVRQFLKQTRCEVNGSTGKKPPGWLLSGRRQAVLRNWPDPFLPMVAFEAKNGTVDHLLIGECRMSPGPVWLFRVGRDGLAPEIASRIVRPGHDYIIASNQPLDDQTHQTESCTINCAGIIAIHLHVPEAIPEALAQQLKAWKLEIARTIRVWPAGFPGRHWDGDGRGEWLTTEKPCLGISPDHKIESLQISLDGTEALTVRAGEPGETTFIQLPELKAGRHLLRVTAQTPKKEGVGLASHEGYLELRVREPESWISGTSLHAGLIVTRSPHDATLDTFWQNEFDLSVVGPEGYQVTPFVALHNAAEEEIFTRQVSGALVLPITPDGWKKHFKAFLQREKCEWRYLDAAAGILSLEGGELGRYRVRFEHELKPVRWVLRHQTDGAIIRLVDETRQEGTVPVCQFFGMERPQDMRALDPEEALRGFKVEPPGGLFTARLGNREDYFAVSTGLSDSHLMGLGVRPRNGCISSDPGAIINLLRILRYWRMARVAGDLGGFHRWQVINTLMHGIVGVVAGWDWARAEAKIIGSSTPGDVVLRLQSLVINNSGFASVIVRDAGTIAGGRKQLTAWFADLSRRYGVESDAKLCQFVMDLASRPHTVPGLYPEGLEDFIRRAKSRQILVRAARLAILCKNCADGRDVGLLPGAGS